MRSYLVCCSAVLLLLCSVSLFTVATNAAIFVATHTPPTNNTLSIHTGHTSISAVWSTSTRPAHVTRQKEGTI